MGGLKFAEYKSDEKLETEGVWFDIEEGARVLVAFAGNTNYNKLNQKLVTPYQGFRRLPEDKADEILVKLLSETILLGWENILDEDNKPIPYSKENAKKLLQESRWLRDRVSACATQEQRFRAEVKEKNLGN